MSEWKPGWVLLQSADSGATAWRRLEKGQLWTYSADLILKVISTSSCGEVVLRPTNPQAAEQRFPLREVTFKGKPVATRDCPFLWADERQARGSNGTIQEGDLLCHEAWDVWKDMHLHGDADV